MFFCKNQTTLCNTSRDGEKERQRKTERQRDRETERRRDGEKARVKDIKVLEYTKNIYFSSKHKLNNIFKGFVRYKEQFGVKQGIQLGNMTSLYFYFIILHYT